MPKELENLVKLPDSLSHVWYWFLDLHNTRSSGFGASPITYCEIQAYFSLLELQVEPWEVDLIKRFDRIALEVTAEQQEKTEKKNKKK